MADKLKEIYSYPLAIFGAKYKKSTRIIVMPSFLGLIELACAFFAAFNVISPENISMEIRGEIYDTESDELLHFLMGTNAISDHYIYGLQIKENEIISLYFNDKECINIILSEYVSNTKKIVDPILVDGEGDGYDGEPFAITKSLFDEVYEMLVDVIE